MLRKIDEAYQKALSGIVLDKQEIIDLLSVPVGSDECAYLCRKANEAAHVLTHDTAYLWGAIGLDYAPCPKSCDFCSFGAAWHLIKEPKVFTLPEILAHAREYVRCGVHFIVLRTTQYYPLERLCEYVRTIRQEIEGSYELILNVGEFNLDMANRLYESGVSGVYHAIRMREGANTRFRVEDRLATLAAVKESPLKLIHLVEPLGLEHTNEEIADRFLGAVRYGAYISGVMARIPVAGTPLGNEPQMSDELVAKTIAVLRLSGGDTVKNICVHPASSQALASGANVVVIETGAIPRDTDLAVTKWKRFDCATAKRLFKSEGYTIG